MRGKRYDVTFSRTATTTTDAEGRSTRTATASTHRLVAALSSSREGLGMLGGEGGGAGQRGEIHDAVVLVPIGFDVARDDQCTISAPAPLGDAYRVTGVRFTQQHLRVLLRRNDP